MTWTTGAFAAEPGWEVIDLATNTVVFCEQSGGTAPVAGTTNLSLAAGTYQVTGFDSYGDGWNGGTLVFTQGSTTLFSTTGPPNPGTGFTPGNNACPGPSPVNGVSSAILGTFVVVAPDCQITCPANITVGSDPDMCGAFVDVPQPVTSDCAGIFPSFASAVTPLNFAGTLTNTPVTITAAFPPAIGDGTLTVTYQGDFDLTTETSVIIDENGVQVGIIGANGNQCGQDIDVFPVTVAQYTAWAADGVITFTLLPDAQVNQLNCAGGEFVQMTIDMPVASVPPYVNDYNFTEDASDNYPVGTTTVVWTTQDATGQFITCSMTVTVVDDIQPVINCPQDITYNLAPGECAIYHDYEVTAEDNCPIQGSVSNPVNPALTNNGQAGIMFTVENKKPFPITISSFDLSFRPGTFSFYTIEVWATTTATTHTGNQTNAAAWTKIGPDQNLDGPFNLNVLRNVSAGPGIVIPANSSRGVYVTSQQFFAGSPMVCEPNATGVIEDDYIRIDKSAGTLLVYPFGGPGTFANYIFYGNLNYAVPDLPVMQTAGLPSGAEFPIGTTQNCFITSDEAGNTNTCCFNVTVNEYANPIQSLVCNDLVQVSVDENCQAVINADQVLEGGPYGCYNNYIVELDKILPFGNGPWVPAVVGPADIGKTYQVRVTDPKTGNKCWGNIKIEDKLPPVLDCPPGSVACNVDPAPTSMTGPVAGPPMQLQSITTGGNTGNPGGLVFFNIDNLSGGDIELTEIGLSINANSTVEIWTKAGTHVGFETNQAAWTLSGTADATTGATGIGVLTPAPITTGPIVLPPGITGVGLIAPSAQHNYTNGTGANQTFTDGTVTLTMGTALNFPWNAPVFDPRVWNGYIIYNTAGVGGVPYPNGLEFNVNVFPTGTAGCYTVTAGAGDPVLEPCSDASLCYLDTEVTQDCASGLTKIINRKWTATDASGNTATCIQVIEVRRPTMASVDLPPSYDDIDEPALSCGGQFPTPDYLEGIGLQGYPYVFGKPDGCSIGWT
ncbi:MAG: HYR domain-containing protein, partial [Saprospiraceae bacterium]|nr:HYR domain-containing protein [Saprospiraceae bacterium]